MVVLCSGKHASEEGIKDGPRRCRDDSKQSLAGHHDAQSQSPTRSSSRGRKSEEQELQHGLQQLHVSSSSSSSKRVEDDVPVAAADMSANDGSASNDDAWTDIDSDSDSDGNRAAAAAAAAAVKNRDKDKKKKMRERTPSPPPPLMPPDRRPTPGRIINPREVNEQGAAPIVSRGDPAEWPNVRDKDYSNRFGEDDDGPPKKLGKRKNPEYEKWQEERPLKDPNYVFHCIYLCAARGPAEEPPTSDDAGYQLDYKKCADWIDPRPRKPRKSKKLTVQDVERIVRESTTVRRTAQEIFFEPGAAPAKDRISPVMRWRWQDKVSKDLGIPFHKVGLDEFEEWEWEGFQKAKKGEYANYSKEQDERVSQLASGSALRKGGCKRDIKGEER